MMHSDSDMDRLSNKKTFVNKCSNRCIVENVIINSKSSDMVQLIVSDFSNNNLYILYIAEYAHLILAKKFPVSSYPHV